MKLMPACRCSWTALCFAADDLRHTAVAVATALLALDRYLDFLGCERSGGNMMQF
jgi:hypothetical protein